MSGGLNSGAERWDAKQVSDFIRGLNPPHYDSYALAFERDGVDGSTLLHDVITTGWLKEKIPILLHRSRIEREIVSLRSLLPPPAPNKEAVDSKGPQIIGASGTGAISITINSSGSAPPTELDPTSLGTVQAVLQHQRLMFAGADVKAEAYDFSSLIESKLSDIKLESFGREWLYHAMYDWLRLPPAALQARPPPVLLVKGEPV